MIVLNIQRIGDNLFCMDNVSLPKSPTVYFVYNHRKELIYIGQTKNLLRRTTDHFRSDMWFKLFARYLSYVDVDIDSLRKIETERIKEFKPRFNLEHYNPISDGEMKAAITEKRII